LRKDWTFLVQTGPAEGDRGHSNLPYQLSHICLSIEMPERARNLWSPGAADAAGDGRKQRKYSVNRFN
jgi:hypothetical protein